MFMTYKESMGPYVATINNLWKCWECSPYFMFIVHARESMVSLDGEATVSLLMFCNQLEFLNEAENDRG